MSSSPPPPAAAGTLLPLAPDECLSLLATRSFGRVVSTHRALPVVLPVDFLLHGSGVLLRVAPGSALAAVRGAVVAFQADDVDVGARTGWSVTVVGRAGEVRDPLLRRHVLAALAPWAGDEQDHVVRISLERVTGRGLARPAAAPAG